MQIRREATLLRELTHPGVVKCLSSWGDERYFYLVLEHCEEGDLLSVAGTLSLRSLMQKNSNRLSSCR